MGIYLHGHPGRHYYACDSSNAWTAQDPGNDGASITVGSASASGQNNLVYTYDMTISGTTATLTIDGSAMPAVTCTGLTEPAYYFQVSFLPPAFSAPPLTTPLRHPARHPFSHTACRCQMDIYCGKQESNICWQRHAQAVPLLKLA